MLGPRQQPRRRLTAARGFGPQQPERVRVKRAGDRLSNRAPEPPGDPVAQLTGCPAAEGEHQCPLRFDLAVFNPLDNGLDNRGGLAGARPGEHQQRPAAMLDRGPLRVVEHGRDDGRGRRAHETGLAEHAPHHTTGH